MPKKKTAAQKKTMTKAAFVRSQPRDMSAKEVIAKAKAAGIPLTEDTIYKTRSQDGKKGSSGSGKKTRPSGTVSAKGRVPDKKNRVLEVVAAHPDWPAENIASEVGCSPTYVYAVWRTKGGAKKAAGKGVASPSNGATTDFYRVLKRIGVEKAKELIANIEAYENA